jgi:tetratricopeptide (TPR) repeat protein
MHSDWFDILRAVMLNIFAGWPTSRPSDQEQRKREKATGSRFFAFCFGCPQREDNKTKRQQQRTHQRFQRFVIVMTMFIDFYSSRIRNKNPVAAASSTTTTIEEERVDATEEEGDDTVGEAEEPPPRPLMETSSNVLAGGPVVLRTTTTPAGRYADTQAIWALQQATDDVSGALSDVSICTSISSSSLACCSLPMESYFSNPNGAGRSTPSSPSRQRRGRDDMYHKTSGCSNNNHHRGKSARKLSSRFLLAKNLVIDAARFLETGEDEKALQAYQQAIQIAGSEIARINAKLRTCACHTDVAQRSIKDRLGQDLRKAGISIGKLRTKMAIVYERLGDYDNAILCCQEAATLYQNLPNNSDSIINSAGPNVKSKTGLSVDLVEAIQLMIQQLQSTKEALRRRDDILRELNTCRADADRAGSSSAGQRAKCYKRMEKLASAAMAVEVKILGACHPQVADSLQLLSTISLELSNMVHAMHFLDQAIAISRQCLGDKHPRIGQYCLRLARICQSTGAETRALEMFEKATQVLSHSKKYSRILGSTMNDIAVIYIRRGETIMALEKLHLALKHYTVQYDRFKSPVETVTDDIIQVHQNLATCYMAEGSFGRASETYAEILALQSRSREIYGGGDRHRHVVDLASIIQTLVNLGRASAAEGDHEKAINSLKKALGMLTTLAADEGANGDADDEKIYVEYKKKITKVMYCIAEECVLTGDLDDAMSYYTDSIGIFNLLGPNRHGKNAGHIAHCQIGISKVLVLRNDAIGARTLLKKTLRNCVSGKIRASHGTIQAVRQRIADIDADLLRPTEESLPVVERNARDQLNEGAFDVAILNLRVAFLIRKKNLRQLKAMKADVSAEVKEVANLLDMFGLVSSLFSMLGHISNFELCAGRGPGVCQARKYGMFEQSLRRGLSSTIQAE